MDCLPKEQFVSYEYLNQLTCSIGLGVYNDPVELPCQHTFCKACIRGWLKKDSTCPKCRNTVNKDLLRPHRIFANMINSSTFTCTNEGCGWSGAHSTFQQHIMTECLEQLCYCPLGCTMQGKRKDVDVHTRECEQRIAECKHCNAKGHFKETSVHEKNCQMREVTCPNACEIKIAASLLTTHLEEECKKRKMICKFKKFIDCEFVGENEEALLEHYTTARVEHLEKLARQVKEFQTKLDKMYQGDKSIVEVTPRSPERASVNHINMVWSNNNKIVSGTVENYWSFFLSKTNLPTPFKARIKIVSVNNGDTNGWKLCLGVFNTGEFTVGSWGKHRNGWGYILGNGNKIFTNASGYGKAYGVNDIITIDWNGNHLSFYKNNVSQGVAFTDIQGPLYLAVAVSDVGHSVQLLDIEHYSPSS